MRNKLRGFLLTTCLMLGSCAQGEKNEFPKNTCMSTADCDSGNECRHQECVNGFCKDIWKDTDGDGYIDQMCGGSSNDCNDNDVSVHPNITESCDCIDNDCDGHTDDGCNFSVRVIDMPTKIFGCFSSQKFTMIDTPSNAPSKGVKPSHNTVFMDVITEGWGSARVWYYGRDAKKYLFPSIGVFESWFGDAASHCCLVKTVPHDVFMNIPTDFINNHTPGKRELIGGEVCYRPDAKIFKIEPVIIKVENMYVVTHNCTVRQLASEDVALEIFGPTWPKLLDEMPYIIFEDYSIGSMINSKADYDPIVEQSRSLTIDNNQDLY